MSIHFFTATDGLPSLSEAVKELLWLVGARSKVAWMVLPTQVGHCPAAAQLTLALSLLLPLPHSSPSTPLPVITLYPPPPKTGTRYHRRAHKGGVFGVSVSRPGAVPALASGRARQGLVPRKAAGASCRAPPPGGIGSAEPKHSPS